MTRTSLLETFAIPSAEEEELAPGPQPAARSERARRVVVAIPLAAIQEASPLQTRQVTFDPQQFAEDAELLASVRQYGVIEPLLVQLLATPFGAPVRYRLIFGNRRAQAARLAGQESVPAIVARSGEPMDALTIAENSGRRELTPYEKRACCSS